MKQPEIIHVPGEPSPQSLRFILNLGHLLLIILLMTWVLFLHYLGKPYDKTFLVAVSQLFGGRAVGVGLGFKQGIGPLFMFYQVTMVDFILMLYIYPIFVRGYQHLTMVPIIGGYLSNIHETALSHKKRMAPYGAAGLIAFVIFPFWSTGCVVGAIVGYLIGLPTWLSLSSVMLGNIAAITAWIAFYDQLTSWNETAAHIFLAVIIALAIAGVAFARIRHAGKTAADAETENSKRADATDDAAQETHAITAEEKCASDDKEEATGETPASGDEE